MTDGPVTDFAGFAEAWREVGPRIEARLRRLGVDDATAADTAQEVAVRALARLERGKGFTSRRGLLGWGHLVARNLGIDAWRKDRRVVPGEVETAAVERGYDDAEWRVFLAATVAALPTLTATQQTAVLALLAGSFPEDKREQVRDSTRRTRARARLRAVVGRLPGLWPPLRRWTARLLPVPALTASLWLTPPAPPASTSVTTTGFQAPTSTAVGRPSAASVTFPVKSSPKMSHRASVHSTAGPRDIGPVHTPVVVVPHPVGELDVGTKPDEARHFVCVEVGPTAVCVDKLGRERGR